jgi:hypothetical protein
MMWKSGAQTLWTSWKICKPTQDDLGHSNRKTGCPADTISYQPGKYPALNRGRFSNLPDQKTGSHISRSFFLTVQGEHIGHNRKIT